VLAALRYLSADHTCRRWEAPHDDHRAAGRDPRRDQSRAIQRPDRANQHPDSSDRPQSLRVRLTPGADHARDAQTPRPLPTTSLMTPPTETSGDS
jgi:hypothetical protein